MMITCQTKCPATGTLRVDRLFELKKKTLKKQNKKTLTHTYANIGWLIFLAYSLSLFRCSCNETHTGSLYYSVNQLQIIQNLNKDCIMQDFYLVAYNCIERFKRIGTMSA